MVGSVVFNSQTFDFAATGQSTLLAGQDSKSALKAASGGAAVTELEPLSERDREPLSASLWAKCASVLGPIFGWTSAGMTTLSSDTITDTHDNGDAAAGLPVKRSKSKGKKRKRKHSNASPAGSTLPASSSPLPASSSPLPASSSTPSSSSSAMSATSFASPSTLLSTPLVTTLNSSLTPPSCDSLILEPPKKKKKTRNANLQARDAGWLNETIAFRKTYVPHPDDREFGTDWNPLSQNVTDRIFANTKVAETNIDTHVLHHTTTAFISKERKNAPPPEGVNGPQQGKPLFGDIDPQVNPKVPDLLVLGYTYVARGDPREAVLFTDRNGIVYAVRAARPQNNPEAYDQAVAEASALVLKIKDSFKDHKKFHKHHRGDFPCISFGLSHGGGQTEPDDLKIQYSDVNRKLLDEFAASPAVRRLVAHVVQVLNTFFPKIALLYTVTQQRLAAEDMVINMFFPGSPFAAQSLNLATQSLAISHLDLQDLVFGLCAILPFGDFNPRRSAHIVLHEPKMIVELGAGDVFLFPSATIHHESIPMAHTDKDSTRQSMIFYSAGGLFRWVRQGHMTQEAHLNGGVKPEKGEKKRCQTAAEKRAADEEGKRRWDAGWCLYPRLQDFFSRT
ncbi:hypothetical protein EUX98_g7615 [Antrodiella citrinella]|uniref:Uncharacterized protein n=1 Tax=Antrodiella citrinella TaxID=2447956 RepID=A0A4V3XHT4_9APHY|nr:hypothetical protein EUX98_g7615 [Antrodiella citrinella]